MVDGTFIASELPINIKPPQSFFSCKQSRTLSENSACSYGVRLSTDAHLWHFVRGLMGLCFFTQAMRCFPWMAMTYWFKDNLKVRMRTFSRTSAKNHTFDLKLIVAFSRLIQVQCNFCCRQRRFPWSPSRFTASSPTQCTSKAHIESPTLSSQVSVISRYPHFCFNSDEVDH